MLAEYILTGWILVIGMTEIAHLSGAFLGRSFTECTILFWIEAAVLGVAGCCYLVWKRSRREKGRAQERARVRRALSNRTRPAAFYLLYGGAVLLALFQLLQVASGDSIYLDGDLTVEQVSSFLAADGMYRINPMTGLPYTLGIPSRLKLLCLPTLYGILSRTFSLSVTQVVWQLIPVLVLLLAYTAYWCAAKALFPGDSEKACLYRGGFLILVILLFWCSAYAEGMEGFGLLYSGFRGVSIRNAVLLPYLFSALLRGKKLPVLLCILAEACIVWTLYGLGVCVAVTVSWYLLAWIVGKWRNADRKPA